MGARSLKTELESRFEVHYAEGCILMGDDTSGFEEAVQAARDSDIMAARVSASIFFMLDSSRFFKSATGSYSAQGAVKCLF